MNANIPPLRCFVRLSEIAESASPLDTEEAYAFGVSSIKGRSLTFHCMLQSGAHYRNVPMHCISMRPDSPLMDLRNTAYWDCFSSQIEITVWEFLRDHEAFAFLPLGREKAIYLFTVDWLPDSPENPGLVLEPSQNKCGHVLATEAGNLAMLPSNKVAWRDGYFIGPEPEPQKRGYIVQNRVYQAESCESDFSKSDRYYY